MFNTRADIFEERADLYDAAIARVPHARRAEFALVLDPLPLRAGFRLADLAAGGAYLWPPLRGLGIDYVAVEPTRAFFDRIPDEQGITALCRPIGATGLADASVDAVVSLACLHHEPSLAPVFTEFRRILRPGGLAVIVDVEAGTANADFLNTYVAQHNPMGHDGTFFDGNTAALLAAVGFDIVEDRVHDISWVFDDRETMGAFLRSLFGAVEATPAEMASAAETRLGITDHSDGIALSWPLRRLICR